MLVASIHNTKICSFFIFHLDRCLTHEGSQSLELLQGSLLQELQRQLLSCHQGETSLIGRLMSILTEMRVLANKLDIILARVVNEFKHVKLPQALLEMMSPEGMAYHVPNVPLQSVGQKLTTTTVKSEGSPAPHRVIDGAAQHRPPLSFSGLLAEAQLGAGDHKTGVNWSQIPSSVSIQNALHRSQVSQQSTARMVGPQGHPNTRVVQSTGGVTTFQQAAQQSLNVAAEGMHVAAAAPQSSLHHQRAALQRQQQQKDDDSPATAEHVTDERFLFQDDHTDFTHFSIAHIFSQPLKFSHELQSEPIIGSAGGLGAPQTTTERILTYENL